MDFLSKFSYLFADALDKLFKRLNDILFLLQNVKLIQPKRQDTLTNTQFTNSWSQPDADAFLLGDALNASTAKQAENDFEVAETVKESDAALIQYIQEHQLTIQTLAHRTLSTIDKFLTRQSKGASN